MSISLYTDDYIDIHSAHIKLDLLSSAQEISTERRETYSQSWWCYRHVLDSGDDLISESAWSMEVKPRLPARIIAF